MSDIDYHELGELKARIKVLEEENASLSENKEELLLLGLISEQVELKEDEFDLLSSVLEKISILKDIPFCAVFSLSKKSAKLISSYSATQETEIHSKQIQVSDQLISDIQDGAVIVDLNENNDFCLLQISENLVQVCAAIVIPFISRDIASGLFLFLFEDRSKKEIASSVMLLQSVVEVIISKLNNISLVRELTRVNADLDNKVKEQTSALLESNKNLKVQIAEQKQLREQIYQSQKMEAIGKLAGGIAHDFNNILTVINGYSELMLIKADPKSSSYNELEQINMAGKRAANLTNQLLAFSRKQVIKPVKINLNDLVSNSEKMLRRLIGEDILLQTILDPQLGNLMADPGQIDQIIINLAVNARDALPKGGSLTIKTQEANVDATQIIPEFEVKPGKYCSLIVSDNGIGMDADTRRQIFEPFFTSKKIGEGTGLGLSTVFGIVKQNNGFIRVESEPGQGSVFHIYLPCIEGAPDKEISDFTQFDKTGNSETILIVEDDLNVQKLAVAVLQRAGYSILTANEAKEALRQISDNSIKIDLLLTDVILPGISGNDLAVQARAVQSDLKVLFMSGYTDDIIAKHGILNEATEFIPKPFTSYALIKQVHDVLEKDI